MPIAPEAPTDLIIVPPPPQDPPVLTDIVNAIDYVERIRMSAGKQFDAQYDANNIDAILVNDCTPATDVGGAHVY